MTTEPSASPAPPPAVAGRTIASLTVGARVCMLLSGLLLLLAALLFWGPIGQTVPNAFPAKCGSAAKPPRDALGKAVCGPANDIRRAQAVTALAGALIVGGGGLVAFGVHRETSNRALPDA